MESADFDSLVSAEMPDAAIVMTPAGQIVHWGQGVERLLGFTAAESVGRHISEFTMAPDRSEAERRLIERTLDAGHATLETLRRRKDGSLVYVDVSSKILRDPRRSEPLILFAEKDVTDLKIESDRRLLQARFRDFLEYVPDGIVVANLTGHIVLANSLSEKLFGYGRDELCGKLVETLLPPRFRRSHVAQRSKYAADARQRGMGSGLDLFGLRKDGSEFPVEISLSPLNWENTGLVMSAIRDATERKRIETALQDLSKRNEMLLREMEHRINNSLQVIASILSLKARRATSDDARLLLRDAQQRVLAVAAVQKNIHNAAQSGLVQVAPYLSQLCNHLASSMIGQSEPITLSVQSDDGEIDSSHAVNLGLIVTELFINAIKYAFPGEDQAGLVVVSYETDGPDWKLIVADNGVGFPTTAQPAARGGGLGKALIDTLAGQLGARVEIVSGATGTSVMITHS